MIRSLVVGACDGFAGYYSPVRKPVWYYRGWRFGCRVGNWTVFRV